MHFSFSPIVVVCIQIPSLVFDFATYFDIDLMVLFKLLTYSSRKNKAVVDF